MESPGKRLRRLIEAPEILVMPGVFDGFSTRLVTRAGYPAAFITGSGVSESRLGQPDVGLMGLDENVAAARAIAACSDLLLIADADTGYGNALNVYHTVRAFERAGVAGIMLEDQVWPKRCGHMKGKEVIGAEEMVQKIRAAAEARVDPDFVIKSRTDVLATHGLAEAMRRLNLYAEAGADLLFADAALSVEQIGTIARETSKPVSVNMGFGIRQRSTTPLLSARQLQDLGVAAVIYPRLLTACALRGMQTGLALLKESLDSGKPVDRPDALVSFEELHEIMALSDVEALEQRFLTASQLEAKYGAAARAERAGRRSSADPMATSAGALAAHAGARDRLPRARDAARPAARVRAALGAEARRQRRGISRRARRARHFARRAHGPELLRHRQPAVAEGARRASRPPARHGHRRAGYRRRKRWRSSRARGSSAYASIGSGATCCPT